MSAKGGAARRAPPLPGPLPRLSSPRRKGRLGPSLVTDQPEYSQSKTDIGLFEIIYGGATGSMQPFSLQGLRQDNILKVMAYVTSLRRAASPADRQAPKQ